VTIAFEQIPTGLRVPGSHVEFSAAKAINGLPAAQYKILLIGQRLSSGTVAALVKQRMTSAAQAMAAFGRGSMLAQMVAAAIAANPTTELWAIACDDNGAGTAAVKTITITGTATAASTLAILFEGVSVPVAVASGATATTVATALAAAINANPDFVMTATSSGGVVTATCRHKGTCGSDVDIRVNHYQGDKTPAGLTVAIATSTSGATNPDVTTVFAAIGDEQYQMIGLGWSDATAMTALDTELTSRWGPMRQNDGRAFVGMVGSFSALSAFGATRNGPHTTIVGMTKLPTLTWKFAAAVCAIAAFNLQIDPARPLTTLAVPGILAPLPEDRATRQERDLLLHAGISTFKVDQGGNVLIERLISTYQTNAFGFTDIAYLDITTTATLSYYRYSMRARIAQKYPRHKLAKDGTNFGAGQAIVTPSIVRAELIALAREWEEAGLMEDVDDFIANLLTEIDLANPSQLNALVGPNVVNGFLDFAARIEFRL
jgi:phage tail sheath gpL-like